jgi:hypothetical protein
MDAGLGYYAFASIPGNFLLGWRDITSHLARGGACRQYYHSGDEEYNM